MAGKVAVKIAAMRNRMKVRRALVRLAEDARTDKAKLAQVDRILSNPSALDKFIEESGKAHATANSAMQASGRPLLDLFQFIIDNREAIFSIITAVLKFF